MSEDRSIVDFLRGGGESLLGYVINIGGELGAIETFVVAILFPTVGMMITLWAVMDLTKMGNPRHAQNVTPASVIVRFCIGPATIQLAILIRAMSFSIFGAEADVKLQEDLAMTYANQAQSQADPVQAGILVGMSFLVLVGWISALRAMLAWARIGKPGQDGYGLFKTGAIRLIVATILCSFQLFMDDIWASATGEERGFSSGTGISYIEVPATPSKKHHVLITVSRSNTYEV